MSAHLSSVNWRAVLIDNDNDPEKVWTKVTEVICDVVNTYIQSKTVSCKTGDIS